MNDERLNEIEDKYTEPNFDGDMTDSYLALLELIAEVRRLQALNSTTNSNWPHEKKLHERIAELEAAYNKLNEHFNFVKTDLEKHGLIVKPIEWIKG